MAICDGSGSVLNRALVARLSPLAFDIRRQCLGSLAWDGDEVAVLTAQSGLSFRLPRRGEEPSGEGTPPGIAIRGAETSADVSSRICAVTSYVSEMAARAVRAELDLLGCSLEVVCGRGARPSAVAEEGLLRVGVAFDAEELLWLSPQKRGAVSTGILRIAAIELADDRPALSEALQAACEDIEEGGCRNRRALLSSESPDGRRAELICDYTTGGARSRSWSATRAARPWRRAPFSAWQLARAFPRGSSSAPSSGWAGSLSTWGRGRGSASRWTWNKERPSPSTVGDVGIFLLLKRFK